MMTTPITNRHKNSDGFRGSDVDLPRVIVVQVGARHNYAIPRMLERAGILEALYTGSSAHSLLGQLANRVPEGLRRPSVQRLAKRRIESVPLEKVFSTDTMAARQMLLRLQNVTGSPEVSLFDDGVLGKRARSWGVRNANVVYSMFGAATDFLHMARAQGCRVAVDVFISPIAHQIVHTEALQYPKWAEETDLISDAAARQIEGRVEEVLSVADILTCPSEHVIDGCRMYEAFEEHKARLVPYSSGFGFGRRVNRPERGRVLFSGKACLRKGIHHLAFAAEHLASRGRPYSFRVAGSASSAVLERPQARHLHFLGWLLRSALQEEYLRADVMAFPSLSEGSASVIYEAMAAGVPVITTPAAGSIITHDYDGVIVPERDAEALAQAIERVVEDRERRDRLASGALETARRQSEEVWQQRLLSLFVDSIGVPDTAIGTGSAW